MLDQLDGVALVHRQVVVPTTGTPSGTLALHVVEAGPPDGTPVVLLHGFPDCWYGWRHQLPALARAGYRVIAYDQRGYASSEHPRGVAAYAMPHLIADLDGLMATLGITGLFHLAGHDWGGGVAWAYATARSERLRTVSIFNCPHPGELRKQLSTNRDQLKKSWYMGFFQLPFLPERLLVHAAARVLKNTASRGTFSAEELAFYQQHAWATPEHLRGAVNWYRAAMFGGFPKGTITAPLQLVWGDADTALGAELVEPSVARVPDHRIVWLKGAKHWVLAERPAETTEALLGLMGEYGGADPWVYKIVERGVWEGVGNAWVGSPDDLRDGFLHLSARHQVDGTLRKHFAGRKDLVVLAVDPGLLPAGALRWEPSRDNQRFPHLYGALPRAAVVAQRAC